MSRSQGISLQLTAYSYTIIDEADEMLHQDWKEELDMLMSGFGMFDLEFCLHRSNIFRYKRGCQPPLSHVLCYLQQGVA